MLETKVAMTFLFVVTLVNAHVAPLQSPLKPVNVYSELADAVQLLLPPYGTGFGVQPTEPPAAGLAVAVIAFCAKVAVTFLGDVTLFNVQDVPLQSPPKLTNP